MKNIDEAIETVNAIMLKEAQENKKMKVYLDRQLKEVQKIDYRLNWFDEQKQILERQKQDALRTMGDLMDQAMCQKHSLKNGYTVLPDNKSDMEIVDTAAFLKWLKTHKKPVEVMKFLGAAIKKTSLKSFCNKEINQQRLNGETEPKIDGVNIGDITYRRLTTKIVKEKK